MMHRLAKYKTLADAAESAVVGVQAEIKKAQQGEEAVDSLRNLQFIKSRLEEIARMLHANAISQDQRLRGSMGRLVVDTWPFTHSLGEQISQIEYDFERLK